MSEPTPDVQYLGAVNAMTDDEFLQEWHDAIVGDSPRRGVVESAAISRFGHADAQKRYDERFPS